jgi:predicted ATPase/DNA-binding XRE family transcriptional regulator
MEDEARSIGSSFGTLLRHHRLAAGLSQEELGERAGVSVRGISALERGFRRAPQRETIALLVKALGLNESQRREFEAAGRGRRGPRVAVAGSRTVNPPGSIALGLRPQDALSIPPFSLSRFVGRQRELEELLALMREHRMVTLTGTGGIGKTQTALRAASAFSETTNTNVCFVGLAPLSDPVFVTATIAAALHVEVVSNHRLLETLAAFLKNENQTLLLDNCEHLIQEVAAVADALLRACPNVRILATSREPLRAAGERAYRLPSLGAADSEMLFIERAQAVDSHFNKAASEHDRIAALCRRLDGIPLAIELAAGRVNLLTLDALIEKLNERFEVLIGGERTAPSRHQTMRATIGWSYDLLSEYERRVFERFSVFAGGCTLEMATSVCAGAPIAEGDMLAILSSLVEKSLITADTARSEPRYAALELLRQFGRQKLIARGEEQTIARRHALAALEHMQWTWRLCNGHSELWADRNKRELENLRSAIEWAIGASGDAPLAQRLVGNLYIYRNFPMVDRRRWIARAFETVDESTPLAVIADLNLVQAGIAADSMQTERQIASARKALSCYRTLHDSRRMVFAAYFGATGLTCCDRPAEAKQLLEEVMPFAREENSPLGLNDMLRALAMTAYLNGDPDSGRTYLAEALRSSEAMSSELNLFHVLEELAECEFCAGNAGLALKYAQDALVVCHKLVGGRARRQLTLSNISRYLVELARFDEADEHARESLAISLENQQDVIVAWNLQNLAAIAALRNRAAPKPSSTAYARSARTLGFVNARLEQLGAKRDITARPQYERVIAAMSAQLGSETVASLMAEGAALSAEQAIELATCDAI